MYPQDPIDNLSEPLSDALDCEILMHRDSHFAGSFEVMIDYYTQEGKGINPEFSRERILELAKIELNTKQNLAAMLLTGVDAEKVAKARESYRQLREVYNKKNPPKIPLLITDLILSEDEDPQEEIDAVVAEKEAIVPSLIELLKSEEFHDPLFPGYGLAPSYALTCLGHIGGKRAIIALFESIGQESFFDENIAIAGLKAIGKNAEQFLLRVLKARPLTVDNERAAIALIGFKDNPEVAEAALQQLLSDPAVLADVPLATYLILTCEGLKDPKKREEFLAIAKREKLPKELLNDIHSITKEWK